MMREGVGDQARYRIHIWWVGRKRMRCLKQGEARLDGAGPFMCAAAGGVVFG